MRGNFIFLTNQHSRCLSVVVNVGSNHLYGSRLVYWSELKASTRYCLVTYDKLLSPKDCFVSYQRMLFFQNVFFKLLKLLITWLMFMCLVDETLIPFTPDGNQTWENTDTKHESGHNFCSKNQIRQLVIGYIAKHE